jgi:hypothetical protein
VYALLHRKTHLICHQVIRLEQDQQEAQWGL